MGQNRGLRIVVSLVAVLLASAHVWKPQARIDSITVVLLVICALPWLQPLIKTVELLGVKLELRDLQDKVADAKGAAESATQQAGLALSASGSSRSLVRENLSPAAGAAGIETLAKEYENIRETQPSGDARTAAMTDVVSRMIETSRGIDSFDVTAALARPSPGMRLFAYAYLYTRPDPQFLIPLVESVTSREDKPFGQYWGLQALGRVISKVPQVPPGIRSKLQTFGAKLPRGTDRDYELRKLLQQTQ
jgi:hypothetical protein